MSRGKNLKPLIEQTKGVTPLKATNLVVSSMAHFGSISPLGPLSCEGQQPKTVFGAGPSGEKLPLHGAWDTAGAYPKLFEQCLDTLWDFFH